MYRRSVQPPTERDSKEDSGELKEDSLCLPIWWGQDDKNSPDSGISQDVKIALEIVLLTPRHLHLKHFVKKKKNKPKDYKLFTFQGNLSMILLRVDRYLPPISMSHSHSDNNYSEFNCLI